jgi:hypothetical protein
MARIIFVIVMIAWLVGAWHMIKMWLNGIRIGDTLFPWPSVITASYNSKNLRIFAASIAVMIVAGIVFNVLLVMGYIADLHIY